MRGPVGTWAMWSAPRWSGRLWSAFPALCQPEGLSEVTQRRSLGPAGTSKAEEAQTSRLPLLAVLCLVWAVALFHGLGWPGHPPPQAPTKSVPRVCAQLSALPGTRCRATCTEHVSVLLGLLLLKLKPHPLSRGTPPGPVFSPRAPGG